MSNARKPRSPGQFGLLVQAPAPFALKTTLNPAETTPGKNVEVTVTATRRPGFSEAIALTVTGLPANVKAEAKPIPMGQAEVKFPLVVAGNAAVGNATITVQGKATHQGKEIVEAAAGVAFKIKK